MKIKCIPDDFRVEERTLRAPEGGPYALYRLAKRGLGTPEAVEAIRRRWALAGDRLSYGGLKDRHAATVQHLTIHRGPRRNLKQTNFELSYLGQCPCPFTSKDIAANAFEVVLRDLSHEEAGGVVGALEAAARQGLPNYFDEQRFGSLGTSGEFAARPWCGGDYERALWLMLADPNSHDRPRQRRERTQLRERWGDWAGLRSELGASPAREVVEFLAACPADYRAAIARVRHDLRSIALAAFQSFLWNELLAALLRERLAPDRLFEISVAGQSLPLPRDLEAEEAAGLRAVELPLPSARIRGSEGPWQELLERVLAEHGLALRELRVKYPRDSFFSKGSRAALVFPSAASSELATDEKFNGRKKATLRFELPRGSYATILIRRIEAGADYEKD
jgi:tRNA pseudouridine13 synthase